MFQGESMFSQEEHDQESWKYKGWRDIVAVSGGNVHLAANTGNSHTIGL